MTKLYATWGAILAAVNAGLLLIGYLAGFQTTNLAVGQYYQHLATVASIIIFVLGARAVREARPDKGLSYGQGVLAVVMIALFSGLFGSIYTYIHFTFINSEHVEYLAAFTREKMERDGMPSEAIDGAIMGMTMFMKPGIMAAMGLIFSPVIGAVLGLIIAIFVKRKPLVTEPPSL
jgi:hypothetical protein